MKYIPNALSIFRMLACVPLLFLPPLYLWFIVVYILAGVSDMIDGPIARKLKVESKLGANLDGAADYIFALVVLFRVVPEINLTTLSVVMIVGVLTYKAISILISYIKFTQLVMMHTYANKLVAAFAFTIPLLLIVVNENILVAIAAAMLFIAISEELVINILSKEPNRDIKWIFSKS